MIVSHTTFSHDLSLHTFLHTLCFHLSSQYDPQNFLFRRQRRLIVPPTCHKCIQKMRRSPFFPDRNPEQLCSHPLSSTLLPFRLLFADLGHNNFGTAQLDMFRERFITGFIHSSYALYIRPSNVSPCRRTFSQNLDRNYFAVWFNIFFSLFSCDAYRSIRMTPRRADTSIISFLS